MIKLLRGVWLVDKGDPWNFFVIFLVPSLSDFPCEWELAPSGDPESPSSPPRPGTFQAPHTPYSELSKCQKTKFNFYLYPSLHSLPHMSALAGFTSQSTTVYPPPCGVFITPLVILQRDFLLNLSRNRNFPLLCFAETLGFCCKCTFYPLDVALFLNKSVLAASFMVGERGEGSWPP